MHANRFSVYGREGPVPSSLHFPHPEWPSALELSRAPYIKDISSSSSPSIGITHAQGNGWWINQYINLCFSLWYDTRVKLYDWSWIKESSNRDGIRGKPFQFNMKVLFISSHLIDLHIILIMRPGKVTERDHSFNLTTTYSSSSLFFFSSSPILLHFILPR